MSGVTPDYSRIAQDLQLRKAQVECVAQLLAEGNTVPFLARYRQERIGGLSEELLWQIQARLGPAQQLAERKQAILRSLEQQGQLTEELRRAILSADTLPRLEDLYLPYKPKGRTPGVQARERGLGPLAEAIWYNDPAAAALEEVLPTLVDADRGLTSVEEVREQVQHLLAEQVAETQEVRAAVRRVLWETGRIVSRPQESAPASRAEEFKEYFQYSESLRHIPAHRILALYQGVRTGVLLVRLEADEARVQQVALAALAERLRADQARRQPAAEAAVSTSEGLPPLNTPPGEPLAPEVPYNTPHAGLWRAVVEEALRLLRPQLEREIGEELRAEAQAQASALLARNLRRWLWQQPLKGQRVLAIDPSSRKGCLAVALDEQGQLLEQAVLWPPPGRRGSKARKAAEASPSAESASSEESGTSPAPPAAGTATSEATGQALPTGEASSSGAAGPLPAESPAPSGAVEAPSARAEAAGSTPASDAESPEALRTAALDKLYDLLTRHHIDLIALGTGAGFRELEELLTELIRNRLPACSYTLVNEAGISHYATSSLAREELPRCDVALRGAIALGRRLQDPLAELVKVDPTTLNLSPTPYEISTPQLYATLEATFSSCVNGVGVDVNTAGVSLLRYVSGLNPLLAREIVEYRRKHGPFRAREQLLQVPGIGPARYVQAAGFLRIVGGEEPLDQTTIHPENYGLARRLLAEWGYDTSVLNDPARLTQLREKIKSANVEELANQLETSAPVLRQVLEALAQLGRDPRADSPLPVFRKGLLQLEDLHPGMELRGTVLRVVDFGVFVDIGLRDSGLVHISQLAPRFIRSPYEVVGLWEPVTVWVLNVDRERRRVSLTMIPPGTERRPAARTTPRRPPAVAETATGRRGPRSGRPTQEPASQAAEGRRPEPATPSSPSEGRPQRAAPAASPSGRVAPSRRVARPKSRAPLPQLSQAALEGKVPLRTFSELSALFAAIQRGQRTSAETAPPADGNVPPPPPAEPPPPPAT